MIRPPVLPGYDSSRGMEPLGDLWAMTKGDKTLTCSLFTHALGWELRANVLNEFVRSQVCRTDTEVFDTSDAWHIEAEQKGWTDEGQPKNDKTGRNK